MPLCDLGQIDGISSRKRERIGNSSAAHPHKTSTLDLHSSGFSARRLPVASPPSSAAAPSDPPAPPPWLGRGIRAASAWKGERPEPDASKLSYHVVEEDFDTRIHRCYGRDVSEFATFDLARDAVVAYLEELIADCRAALDGIKSAASYEEYART